MKFPLRTFIVCVTTWAVATELMLFDYIKFDAKRELLEQTARLLQQRQSSLESPPL
jgi:hypothetical protein